jgi:hypothetical protein
MNVTSLEYKSNQFCNSCFNERASGNTMKEEHRNSVFFMGEEIRLWLGDGLKGAKKHD